jgi:hypothetical protein
VYIYIPGPPAVTGAMILLIALVEIIGPKTAGLDPGNWSGVN